MGALDDPRTKEGVEHLQAAARELIAAARTFLDVAEEVVSDPATLESMAATAGDLWRVAASRAGAAARGPADDDDDDDGPSGRVERIPLH